MPDPLILHAPIDDIVALETAYREATDKLQDEVESLRQWVDDLQADCYINCVYCGHRYGPDDEVPASMADVLKEHVEQCPEHPLSAATETIARLRTERDDLREVLRGGLADYSVLVPAVKRTAWYAKACGLAGVDP